MKQASKAFLIAGAMTCLGTGHSKADDRWVCNLSPGNYKLSFTIAADKLIDNAAGTPSSIIVESNPDHVVAFRQNWIDHIPSSTTYIIEKSSGGILEISNVAASAAGEHFPNLSATVNKGSCVRG